MTKHASGAGRGMARGLTDYLEIPPKLAERAGEPALAAMMEIKHGVDAGGGDLRQVHLCHAQNHMARLDPYRHGTLLQHLQALVVSLGGRRGDTRIAHVTLGEVVLGDDLMTPDVVDLLRRTAKEKGLDYERFVVGSGRNSINPRTGQMEFYDDGADESSGEQSPTERIQNDLSASDQTTAPAGGAQGIVDYTQYQTNAGLIPTMTVYANAHGNDAGSNASDSDSDMQTCVGPARILQGNANLIGKPGGLSGTKPIPVTPHSAAFIPSQFGLDKPALRMNGPSISGTLNGQPLFSGLTDVVDNKYSPVPGMTPQEALQYLNPGSLILELPSASQDMGTRQVSIRMPRGLLCPTGTR
jgi:hypothetical protein